MLKKLKIFLAPAAHKRQVLEIEDPKVTNSISKSAVKLRAKCTYRFL